MARERKKPEGSFIERAKNEIENEDTLLTKRVCELGSKRAYELGRIRGRKEQEEIDAAENGKALCYAVDKTAKRVKKEMIEKACEFFAAYLVEIGYPDDWCRDSKVQKSGEQRFREFMEEQDYEDAH